VARDFDLVESAMGRCVEQARSKHRCLSTFDEAYAWKS
jgi:hypothetical protein